ncbi:uncharacterized protein cobll1a isoform X2 [Misgurnus anguillicaudatus]|uniref:uncharacterized protein cobll1a isoform X2 n=1 Tax=Misgurnus anguillicaudatus TaxID=75329 RepID=UPI003CCF7F86
MDPQQDLTERDITLTIQLPGGQETTTTVHGSKPVMDVLVTLCAQHRLVPSDNVIKLISANHNHIRFKPNSPIGSLEFEKVVLQPKGSDDANKKKPHMPVATVRLMINYKKSHKAVVRVNPKVPLAELVPLVCEKCEFNPNTTIFLRTCHSEDPLDLTKTLNDYGIKELYAKDTKGGDEEQKTSVKEKIQREKGNKRFFSLFKKSKKTPEQALTTSAPGSPELNNRHAVGVRCLNGHSTLQTGTVDVSKKRRAPRPPLVTSQSVPCEFNTKDYDEFSERDTLGKQGLLSRISSTESSLKRTKRRAPPPPSDEDNKENVDKDDNSSDKHRAHIADRCPAIAEVMSELVESLQARHKRTLSSVTSSSSQQQTTEDSSGPPSELSTPEVEFKTPPGCQLVRSSSEREGLTTFTVVPQRRLQGGKCFDVAPDPADAGQKLSPGTPEDLEIHSAQLPEVQTESFRNDVSGLDKRENLPEIPQHLEKENQTWANAKNLEQKHEKQLNYLKPIKKGGLQSFNNIEPLNGKTNNLELRNAQLKSLESGDTWTGNLPAPQPVGSPRNSNVDESLVEGDGEHEYALVETGKEKNWIEQYQEKRRMFQGCDDDNNRKLHIWRKFQSELRNAQIDDNFPSPPPPVCWYDEDGEGENDDKEPERDLRADIESHLNSNFKYQPNSHSSKPKAHSTQTIRNADYTSAPESPGTSILTSRPSADCPFKSHSTSDPCSTETVSPFALAVFQKAKHFKSALDTKHAKR